MNESLGKNPPNKGNVMCVGPASLACSHTRSEKCWWAEKPGDVSNHDSISTLYRTQHHHLHSVISRVLVVFMSDKNKLHINPVSNPIKQRHFKILSCISDSDLFYSAENVVSCCELHIELYLHVQIVNGCIKTV